MSLQTVILKQNSVKRLKGGHPWIFSNELVELPIYEPGSLVNVFDLNKQFIGCGYYNPHSLISIRILTRNPGIVINTDFFKNRIQKAYEYRQSIYPGDKSYRMVYSEGDFLPGLIIDRYENYFVIQILTKGMDIWKDIICRILMDLFHPAGIYERSDSQYRQMENLSPVSQLLFGSQPDELIIQQDGLKFKVDLIHGQKTGFFFDHRNNRVSLIYPSKGAEVLDLFCGNGAWSCYAAQGGAKYITGIDSSHSALQLAQINAQLNNCSDQCEWIEDDVLDIADKMVQEKKKFDLVICDPPAFAKSKKHLPTAIKGYLKLNQMALQLTKPGGLLVTSSCSYHIGKEEFKQILMKCSTKTNTSVYMIRYGTQSLDHPILIHVPETEYLKCYTLKILDNNNE